MSFADAILRHEPLLVEPRLLAAFVESCSGFTDALKELFGEPPQARVENGVGILPICGPIGVNLSPIEKMLGGCDVADLSTSLDTFAADPSVRTLLKAARKESADLVARVDELTAASKTAEAKAAEICASVGVTPLAVTAQGDAVAAASTDLAQVLCTQETPAAQTAFWRKNKSRISTVNSNGQHAHQPSGHTTHWSRFATGVGICSAPSPGGQQDWIDSNPAVFSVWRNATSLISDSAIL